MIFNDGAVAAGPAGRTLDVTITPLAPGTFGPPREGTRFDGNACRFDAVYGKSGPVQRYARPVTVILRYATGGTQIVRAVSAGQPAWDSVRTIRYAGHLHLLVADTTTLGVFAPVAPAGTPYTRPVPWAGYAAVAAAFIVFAALLVRRSRRRGAPPAGQSH